MNGQTFRIKCRYYFNFTSIFACDKNLPYSICGLGEDPVLLSCHNINSPGINDPEEPFTYDSINGPRVPFMSSYMVWPDHLYIDLNSLGKT